MKDFLLVLFYQAIVAVNTAVVLSGIIWLAKRKDEKDERKPNPDFTPPPEKKPSAPQTTLCENCRYRNQPCHRTGIRKCSDYIKAETPKPPTTGKSVVKPKKRKYDEYSALQYAVDTVQRLHKPILTSAIVQAEDGKIIIPPEEAGAPVSGYGDGKIYGYVQTLAPDDGNDDGKAYPINPGTGEVEDYPAIDGTIYRVYFWTSGKAVKTVHMAPSIGAICCDSAEAQKEASFTVYTPADESVKRYETDFINAECKDCKFFINTFCVTYCDKRRCQVGAHERRRCHFFKRYEEPVRTTHICKNCKHYLATEERSATGLCGMMEEIVSGYSYHACFEKREEKDHE